jgi:hypothetical protein
VCLRCIAHYLFLLLTLNHRSPPLNKATSALKGFKKRWFVVRRDSTTIKFVNHDACAHFAAITHPTMQSRSLKALLRWRMLRASTPTWSGRDPKQKNTRSCSQSRRKTDEYTISLHQVRSQCRNGWRNCPSHFDSTWSKIASLGTQVRIPACARRTQRYRSLPFCCFYKLLKCGLHGVHAPRYFAMNRAAPTPRREAQFSLMPSTHTLHGIPLAYIHTPSALPLPLFSPRRRFGGQLCVWSHPRECLAGGVRAAHSTDRSH